MKQYCGIYLHSDNVFVVVVDDSGNTLLREQLPSSLAYILAALESFESLTDVVVISRFNWYWLGTGLPAKFKVHFTNPSKRRKFSRSTPDSFFNEAKRYANLLRAGKSAAIYKFDSVTEKNPAKANTATENGIDDVKQGIDNAFKGNVDKIKEYLANLSPFRIPDQYEPPIEDIVRSLNEHYAKLEVFSAINLSHRKTLKSRDTLDETPDSKQSPEDPLGKNDLPNNSITLNVTGSLNSAGLPDGKATLAGTLSHVKDKVSDKVSDHEIAYRLAATDLFVERATEYLTHRATQYKHWGIAAYAVGIFVILIGVGIAGYSYDPIKKLILPEEKHTPLHVKFLGENPNINFEVTASSVSQTPSLTFERKTEPNSTDTEKKKVTERVEFESSSWLGFIERFVHAFTFYGFIVLLAVSAWRVGKACLDQSERIFGKRHAMRQGRLFIHLQTGKLSITELEGAFKWNVSQENAFSNIPTDAKAPWGAVVTDALKAVPDIIRAGRGQ